eukprot:m51a1_g13188 putative protein unc- isoform l (439) ;mRNA; f:745-2673
MFCCADPWRSVRDFLLDFVQLPPKQDDHVPADELLSITVLEARNLKPRSGDVGAPVIVRVTAEGNETLQTHKAAAGSPVWNETLQWVRAAGDSLAIGVRVAEIGHVGAPRYEDTLGAKRIVLGSPAYGQSGPGDASEYDYQVDMQDGLQLLLRVSIGPIVKPEDKYDFTEKLGEGGQSAVYRVVEKSTGKHYAAKVVHRAHQATVMDRKSLVQEIWVMQSLDHENIVRLHEVIKTRNRVVLVMELVEGGDLFHQIVQRKTLGEPEARRVFGQLVSAVDYLHTLGICHRDLKPENVLVTGGLGGLRVKLADFGLAVDMTVLHMFLRCGSPSYVAPEILAGQPYTEQCDVWSLGVILYVMLSGWMPFYSHNRHVLYERIRRGQFAFENDNWKAVSPSARELVGKMLVVDPRYRITTQQILESPWLNEQNQCECESPQCQE